MFVVAMHPIAQRLPVHRAGLRRGFPRPALQDQRHLQQQHDSCSITGQEQAAIAAPRTTEVNFRPATERFDREPLWDDDTPLGNAAGLSSAGHIADYREYFLVAIFALQVVRRLLEFDDFAVLLEDALGEQHQ